MKAYQQIAQRKLRELDQAKSLKELAEKINVPAKLIKDICQEKKV